MRSHSHYVGTVVVGVFTALCGGCSTQQTQTPNDATSENLRKVARAYVAASTALQRPPQNAADLTAQLKESGDSDAILVSPRDREPFIVLWGVPLTALTAKPPGEGVPMNARFPVLAYEKTGVGGKRYVLQAPTRVVEMTDAELREAYFPAGHQPPR